MRAILRRQTAAGGENRGQITSNPQGKNMIKLSKMHKRLLAIGATLPMAALAQESAQAPAGQLEVVTVTAQRRAENIREVPVSVSMIKDEKLDILLSGGQDIRVLA